MRLTFLAAALLAATAVQAANRPTMAPAATYMMDRATEIALARTGAPPSVSAKATVLVLGPHGYETAVRGSNGYTCFVERSWTAGLDDPVFWDPQIRAPSCYNPAAVATVLPTYRQRTEWVLAGATREEVARRTRAALAAHRIVPPGPGAFSFMLSKEGNLGEPAKGGPWLPHVMFFLPHGQAAAWAAGLDASPIVGGESREFEPTVLFIPVRRWSDGSPAPAASDLSHKM